MQPPRQPSRPPASGHSNTAQANTTVSRIATQTTKTQAMTESFGVKQVAAEFYIEKDKTGKQPEVQNKKEAGKVVATMTPATSPISLPNQWFLPETQKPDHLKKDPPTEEESCSKEGSEKPGPKYQDVVAPGNGTYL